MVRNLSVSSKACVGLLVSLTILAGCASSQPSRFYVLSSLSGPAQPSRTPAGVAPLTIGVGPVNVPDYLDRIQIVTRTTMNTLELAEFDRWAEPLDRSLPRILVENLNSRLPGNTIVPFPWQGSTRPDYQVAIELTQLDGVLGQQAWLEARWTVLASGGKQVLGRGNAHLSETVGKPSYEALVSAWSKALAGLSGEIATTIQTVVPEVSNQRVSPLDKW